METAMGNLVDARSPGSVWVAFSYREQKEGRL
jgi:hypothetical protein